MSYCYADDDTSDRASSPHHYRHLMPESPLQAKLSSNHSSNTSHLNRVASSMSPNSQLEHEKRVRREIANSNERRRMQSINTGFQSLKILIPHSCGEKLSKACILQRAADHIKTLENEKLKLQSQNEQFRILIKSFQIDSTSVLREQRRLSTNDADETVLLVNNETKSGHHEEVDDEQLRLYHDVKTRHQYIPNWHSTENVTHYSSTTKEDIQDSNLNSYYYPSSSTSATYRAVQSSNSKGSSTTSDTAYMIVKPHQPSQRCYKTNSLDQTNENGIVILERCQLRAQSVDTNNNTNTPSTSSNVLHHPVSRRNLQTIVEAIRHVEGDEVLSNMSTQQSSSMSSSHQQEDLPAQIKAMIHEKFQQQVNKNSSMNNNYSPTINSYEQTSSATVHPSMSGQSHEIDLHQKPPKKRKITYNENDDLIEQMSTTTTTTRQEIPPISSPDVHHHEQISSDSSPSKNLLTRSPSTVAQLLQEHLSQRPIRFHSHPQT